MRKGWRTSSPPARCYGLHLHSATAHYCTWHSSSVQRLVAHRVAHTLRRTGNARPDTLHRTVVEKLGLSCDIVRPK